ncbi:MAG TPA: hypothetical protein VG890_15935 [Puia sp.]|nr:hypothetical protein [Puia sp.]
MKKLMMMVLSLGLVLGAAAQRGHAVAAYHAPTYYVRPSVRVGFGFGYYPAFAPYGFYSPYYWTPYGPFYYPYASASRPSKLSMKVQDIKNDYADRIYSVKQDTRLTHKERRQKIRELKKERDKAVDDEIANYHNKPVTR